MPFALKTGIKMRYDNQTLEDNHDYTSVLYSGMAERKCANL
jgi:hypothetical protein